jgi:hypothetical protein
MFLLTTNPNLRSRSSFKVRIDMDYSFFKFENCSGTVTIGLTGPLTVTTSKKGNAKPTVHAPQTSVTSGKIAQTPAETIHEPGHSKLPITSRETANDKESEGSNQVAREGPTCHSGGAYEAADNGAGIDERGDTECDEPQRFPLFAFCVT